MRVILKRPRAREELLEIWEFIADDCIVHADAFIGGINAKIQTLAAQPRWAAPARNWRLGCAVFLRDATSYFYEVILDGIALVRVLHGARDVASQFEDL